MQQPTLKQSLALVGSLKLTFTGIGLLIGSVLASYFLEDPALPDAAGGWWLAPPLVLLAFNLAAAMLVDPRLNRRLGLLTFHVALLAIIVLAVYDELAGLHGRVELVSGQSFDPDSVVQLRMGPLHPADNLEAVRFVQGAIRVDYAPGIIRQATRSDVYREETARWEKIGDNVPFRSNGYVLHTTSNKGFAAIVTWSAKDARPQTGAIHFPSYPLKEWRQVASWQSRDGQPVMLSLEGLDRVDENTSFTLNESRTEGVTLSIRGQHLAAGETVTLPDGRLTFQELRLWMGYEIRSRPLTPWMFLAAMLGICGIGWHFLAPERGMRVLDLRAATHGPEELNARHA